MLELRHLAFDCYLSLKEFTNSVSNDVRCATTIKTYQTPWEEISFDSKFILLSLTTNRQIILAQKRKAERTSNVIGLSSGNRWMLRGTFALIGQMQNFFGGRCCVVKLVYASCVRGDLPAEIVRLK